MSSLTYLRMLGYVTTILLHGGNLVALGRPLSKEMSDDLKVFTSLQARFLTVWTFCLQAIFAISGLWCDILTLRNSKTKDYRLPKHLKGFRDTLFASIVWPTVFVVSTTFWPLFIYDRSLVFPEFLDQLVSPLSNHIMHSFIIPLALWEVVLQPRTRPKSHLRYNLHTAFHIICYMSVFFYTFFERGIWLYPLVEQLYGTIYLYAILLVISMNCFIFYAIQWPLTEMIWGTRGDSKKRL